MRALLTILSGIPISFQLVNASLVASFSSSFSRMASTLPNTSSLVGPWFFFSLLFLAFPAGFWMMTAGSLLLIITLFPGTGFTPSSLAMALLGRLNGVFGFSIIELGEGRRGIDSLSRPPENLGGMSLS